MKPDIKKREHMPKLIKFLPVFILFSCLIVLPANAGNRIHTQIKIIKASTQSNHVDPELSGIISQFKRDFRYTSYRLVRSQNLNQSIGQSGRTSLPGGRTLVVTPITKDRGWIRYKITILKNNKAVLQTQFKLKNNTDFNIVLVRMKKGALLLNIFGSAN